MAIPESQLVTWSHQGSITQSKNTYASIRNALLDSKAVYADKSFNVFLQGSYGNYTNIYAESDVDIVIRLDSIIRSGLSNLPAEQQTAYHQAFSNATYTFAEFKTGVITRLSNAFGAANVIHGNKAIKIKASGSRRSADVVTCYQYRNYIRFISLSDQKHVSGIIFPTSSSGEIINYPKLHSENCTNKHQATNNWFKPMARIMKNMRSRLVNDGVITHDTAPSYYIEGLLYNVPKEKFGKSYGDSFVNCIKWILEADRSKFRCANEQYLLLHESSPVTWRDSKCTQFLTAACNLWEQW